MKDLEQRITDEINRYATDPDLIALEQTLVALIARKNAAPEGSAERAFARCVRSRAYATAARRPGPHD